ncbi:MAG TPA: hypothetical protein VGC62_19030, partial [Pseudomonas sp.]|uniref:hypothetical protein n=1 Tax=Pseudomonas sp. TaxID=306 RepID=UPI002EDAF1B3
LLYRLNNNANAIACAVEEISNWIDQRGSTDVSGRVADHLAVVYANSDLIAECMAEMIAKSDHG